jgi:hypothetical protein
MVEFDIPAMVHVSTSCNACFHTTGAHYLNADTTAFMQCLTSDLFKDFPTLKFVIPHGGGAVPYHWGRYRGLAQELKKPLLKDHLLNNIFFDTCVYHQPGIDLLTTVIPVDNILFASEMIGAVRGIDPETGHYYDDTKRYIEASTIVVGSDRHKIYEGNARRVYPRLDAALKARGAESAADRHSQGARPCLNWASSSAISPAPTAWPPTAWRSLAAPPCTRPWAAWACCSPTCGPSTRVSRCRARPSPCCCSRVTTG